MADGLQPAREPRQPGGEHERDQHLHARVVADALRARAVVADRAQRLSERRLGRARGDQIAERRDGEREVIEMVRIVEVDRSERPERNAGKSIVAAGVGVGLPGDEIDHLRERERHHREVDSRAPDRQISGRNREHERGDGPEEQRHGHRKPRAQKHVRRHVRAGAPEHGVAERKQPRVAKDEVEGEREQSPGKDVHRQDGIDEARQDQQQEQDTRAHHPAPGVGDLCRGLFGVRGEG